MNSIETQISGDVWISLDEVVWNPITDELTLFFEISTKNDIYSEVRCFVWNYLWYLVGDFVEEPVSKFLKLYEFN